MKSCGFCQKSKSLLTCACCAESVCKNCALFLDANRLDFWDQRPSYLKESVFCPPCFDTKIQPAVDQYDRQLKEAHQLSIFFDNQGKETRFLSRKEKPIEVHNLSDREEVLLKLAFQAVLAGFNGLIDVQVSSEKKRNAGYQTQIYKGSGIPTMLPDRKLAKS
jgi:hypothetical protein